MRRMRQMKKKKNLNTLELNIVFLGTCVYVPKSSWVKSSCLENILQSLQKDWLLLRKRYTCSPSNVTLKSYSHCLPVEGVDNSL